MKHLKYIFFIFLSVGLLSSCKKDLTSEGVSKITYFPEMTLQGDQEVFHALGTAFTDPGAKAVANGQNLDVTTSVVGEYRNFSGSAVDGNTANKYIVSYTSKNADGFAASISRDVYVAKKGDLVSSIEGLYTVTTKRNGASGAQYTNMKYIMIWKTGANTYQISDAIGDYYYIGRAYGPGYMAPGGVITAVDIPTNNFTFGTGAVVGTFGGGVTFTSMTVNPATKTITYQSKWNVYTFDVTLTQVQF